MVELYIANINEDISNDVFARFLNSISIDKRNRIKRYHFINDAKRTLYGDILVRNVACNKLSVSNSMLHFEFDEFGKPYLKGYPKFCFNISHSHDWVVCAVSVRKVGVDVEKIKKIDFDIAKKFFTAHEYNELSTRKGKKRLEFFYDLWTLKEAYLKYIGKGLALPLNSFDISIDDKTQQIDVFPVEFPNAILSRIIFDADYKLSICSEEKEIRLCEVSISQLRSD